MKKKLLSIALIAVLIAIVVSGTLAYFTTDDTVDNVFTIGSVLIEIWENGVATDKDTVTFDKPLVPVVDTEDLTTDPGYAAKVVKVKNTGSNAAYIRTYIAVPKDLGEYLILDTETENGWKKVAVSEATKDGVVYTVHTYDHMAAVDPDTFTAELLKGAYLASTVDIKDNPDTASADLEFCKPNGDGTYTFSGFVAHNKVTDGYKTATVKILVASQAIQAQGFENGTATDALDAGFGQGKNPWQA